MARQTLTANKRRFRKNPKSFLNKITEAPVKITINDGVNPEYTITYSPVAGDITESEGVPPGTSFSASRETTPRVVEQ